MLPPGPNHLAVPFAASNLDFSGLFPFLPLQPVEVGPAACSPDTAKWNVANLKGLYSGVTDTKCAVSSTMLNQSPGCHHLSINLRTHAEKLQKDKNKKRVTSITPKPLLSPKTQCATPSP